MLSLTFIYMYKKVFLGQTWCYVFCFLVNLKTRKAKKKIITSCRVMIPRIILLKTCDFFIGRRKNCHANNILTDMGSFDISNF